MSTEGVAYRAFRQTRLEQTARSADRPGHLRHRQITIASPRVVVGPLSEFTVARHNRVTLAVIGLESYGTMRRDLTFEFLNQAVEESESLLCDGYSKSGNWTLAQIACHLRLTIEKNMLGYPRWMVIVGYPLRPFLRRLVLPKLLAGNSPNGFRTAGIFVPPENLDDVSELDKFKKCVESFTESDQPLHAHPGFGDMSKDEFNHFHAAHAAHHLSFLHSLKATG